MVEISVILLCFILGSLGGEHLTQADAEHQST